MVNNGGVRASRAMAFLSLRPNLNSYVEKGALQEEDILKEIERLEKKESIEEFKVLFRITNPDMYYAGIESTIDGLVETVDSLTTTVARLEARIVALESKISPPVSNKK